MMLDDVGSVIGGCCERMRRLKPAELEFGCWPSPCGIGLYPNCSWWLCLAIEHALAPTGKLLFALIPAVE